jgi:hypothetical protein
MQDTRKGLLPNLSGKVEEILHWQRAVDQKQDEVDRNLDEVMSSITQL